MTITSNCPDIPTWEAKEYRRDVKKLLRFITRNLKNVEDRKDWDKLHTSMMEPMMEVERITGNKAS